MWNDPFSVFGLLSVPILVSNLITLLGFFLATYFAIRYTIAFYGGREKPKSWVMIVIGMTIISIAELGQFTLPYVQNPTLIEGVFGLITQDIGIAMIALGCFLLFREVP